MHTLGQRILLGHCRGLHQSPKLGVSRFALYPSCQHYQAMSSRSRQDRQDQGMLRLLVRTKLAEWASGSCTGVSPHLHSRITGTAPLGASPPPRTPGYSALEAASHCAVLSAATSSPALMRSGPGAGQGSSGPAGHCPADLAHSSLPAGTRGEWGEELREAGLEPHPQSQNSRAVMDLDDRPFLLP